jgi:DNA-binding NarL/FixJ family response regulator
MPAKIVLVDDHVLLRKGLADLVRNQGYIVLFEAGNGKEFCENLQKENLPDLVLLDLNMPVMDGYETALWIKRNHPDIKVLALSMYDDENAVIRMLKNGARGYILKDTEPAELRSAIEAILSKGFYYSEMVTGRLIHSISGMDDERQSTQQQLLNLTEREIEFLKLACSEMTYKEIADKMHLSPRTVDGYRDTLFQKLELKTRTGLVIYAIKNGIVQV